jgi:hypothetical protein
VLCLLASLHVAKSFAQQSVAEESRSWIPWKSLPEPIRTKLEEVIDQATVHHRCPSEVFASSPELYLLYLNDPVLTLELWKAIGGSHATLEAVGPGQFEGADGHVSTGKWEFVYRSPELNVIYAEGQYRGPLLGTTLETKSVLILRTAYFQERDGKKYVKHQLDGFVKADAGNLKPLAKALKPVFQKNVESTMQESMWFVSLMCRYTLYDPHTIASSLEHIDKIAPSTKTRLQQLLMPLLASVPKRKDVPGGTD